MRIVVYGGSFNPPHRGHIDAANAACVQLQPDKFLLIPAADPPHKALAEGSPSPEMRLHLTQLAAQEIPNAEVSGMELKRTGKSYSSDTVQELMRQYPGAEIVLIVGTDMLLYFEEWHEFEWLLKNVTIAAFVRDKDEETTILRHAEYLNSTYGGNVICLNKAPLPMSSTEIREQLCARGGRDLLSDAVYSEIVRSRLYGVKPDFAWLREQAETLLDPRRVPHVLGCEEEAARLAERWGADVELAREAAILHDITKRLPLDAQLPLCEKYGILIDDMEKESSQLLHAKTGAALARACFGVSDAVHDAIFWHTTAKADMTLLEQVIYLADYIEPTRRDFDGLADLRKEAYRNLNDAMILGLTMGLADLERRGIRPHPRSAAALDWFRAQNT